MPRRCFYSFHYQPDSWRASQVRQIGAIEGNRPATDNEWESVASGPNASGKIALWIDAQMYGRSCAIVLVGSGTANRPWINYEIRTAWEKGLGVVGINIHGLMDMRQATSYAGANPFDFVSLPSTGVPISSVVSRYDPPGYTSQDRYSWISDNLGRVVEEAITVRSRFP